MGYTVFPLNIRNSKTVTLFCVTVFPLNNKGKNCVGGYTVFSLNIRDEFPNSVDLFQPIPNGTRKY